MQATINNLSFDLNPETHTATYNIESRKTEDDIIVPETVSYKNEVYRVTAIESHEFINSSSIRSIQIPESVTSIGERTFCGYSNLQAIHIPKSVTHIADREVFAGCSSLTSISVDPANW